MEIMLRRNSANSIWTPDLSRRQAEGICEDTCQLRLYYQWAILLSRYWLIIGIDDTIELFDID